MQIYEIQKQPTSITSEQMREILDTGCKGAHESVCRAFHVARKIREMLERGDSKETILECIELMEMAR